MQTPRPIACFDEQERDALLAAPANRLKELTRHRGLSVNKLMEGALDHRRRAERRGNALFGDARASRHMTAFTLWPTREAVRDRIEVVRRQASMRPEPVVIRAHRRAFERERAENARELETMRRVLVHAFPQSNPEVIVLLDMSQRDIRTYTRDDIGQAIARLAGYQIIAGVGVRPLLRGLQYRHALEQRLAELAPPQKTMKINQRGRLLKISNELLITSSCQISRPLGDAKMLRDYLRDGMHARLRRRMEADAKSLFGLYSSITVSWRTPLDRSWMLKRQKEAS